MRRLGLFGAVLLVLAVVYVAAWRTQPGTTRAAAQPGPRIAAVTSVTRSCPPPAPGTGAAHVALIALPSQAAAARGGASGAGAATLIAVPATTGPATTGTAKPGAAKPGTGTGTGPARKPAAPAPRPLTVSA